jgi:hypothetical protein
MADPNIARLFPWLTPNPRPAEPQYQPAYDPTTMALAPKLQSFFDEHGGAIKQYMNEAQRKGLSPYSMLALQEQERQGTMSRDSNRRTAGAASAQARADLARSGGLSSGARERVATNAENDLMGLNQQTSATQLDNNAQLRMNDERNRLMELQQAGTFSLDQGRLYGQANQFDLGQQTQENQSKNAFAMDRYNAQMQAWAAEQQARATPQGKK